MKKLIKAKIKEFEEKFFYKNEGGGIDLFGKEGEEVTKWLEQALTSVAEKAREEERLVEISWCENCKKFSEQLKVVTKKQ